VDKLQPADLEVEFSLDGDAPAGCSIEEDSGKITWTPAQGQGGKDYAITVVAGAKGRDDLRDEKEFLVSVTESEPPGPSPTPSPVAVTPPSPQPPVTPTPQPGPKPVPAPGPKPQTIEVPFITWGGDMATFYANQGETTQPGSIFDQLGLKLKLTNGDDFIKQVDRYKRGEIDFLRGTFSMLGLASDEINADPETQVVVFLQLTWSAGDHMVARGNCKSLNDLKGKKVAIQRGGPHVGMLNDSLRTAGLGWKDIEVVWVDNLTGANSPAQRFREDPSVDACTVISPDMALLTGDEEPEYELGSVGTGRGDSVKDAHILISTAWMSRSICDVYACRKSFYDQNRETVEKFVAGYLKACEQVVKLKRDYDNKRPSSTYQDLLKLSQTIFGEEAIPTTGDAHGLISDCSFVRLPGNNSFFTNDSNLSGFTRKHEAVLDLAVELSYAEKKMPFLKPDWDYPGLKEFGRLQDPVVVDPGELFPQGFPIPPTRDDLEKATIYSFAIQFDENVTTFPPEEYGDSFQRAIDQATLWGRAGLLVRGHADPTATLKAFVEAGMKAGDIEREGSSGSYRYTWKPTGETLDLTDTARMVEMIHENAPEIPAEEPTNPYNFPATLVDAAIRLSNTRTNNVRKACVAFAESRGIRLDESQIQTEAVGIQEPVVAKPSNLQEAAKNRRVEFRLLRVAVETVREFDF
jgi:hypothetical protein